jgi:hypothetical protein
MKAKGRVGSWLVRWGPLSASAPVFALLGCVSDPVFRDFLVSQFEATIVEVFALAAGEVIAQLFPTTP